MNGGDPETRRRILEATWRLMETGPGRGVRMQDIAAAAEVSRQALYLHFASRTDLLIATVQYVDEKLGFNEQMQAVFDAPDSRTALAVFIKFWASYVPQIHGVAGALLAARASDQAAATAWRNRMEGLRRICGWLVDRLAREGQLASEWLPAKAADMLWALISVQLWVGLTVERGWTSEAYATHLSRVARRALLAEESHNGGLSYPAAEGEPCGREPEDG
ncbi:MAG: TetR/AcrR family transcriptional regulator [Candidatus Promineifilaceae bacterium]|nr:TetR/AcrR family transcriptional regulator [Candidatus Promineifilaceae bacterium]